MNKKTLEALAVGGAGLAAGLSAYLSRKYDILDLQSLGCVARANAEHLLSGLSLSTIGAFLASPLDYTKGKEENFMKMFGCAMGAIAYVGADLFWEKISANVRGYYQSDQVVCDIMGISLPLIYFALKNRKKEASK